MASLFSNMALQAAFGEMPYNYLGVEHLGYLSYSTQAVMSPNAKFAVEQAQAQRGLVHIRSCSTNKYWVRSKADENWITATASKPEVDLTLWNCTLFRMVITDDAKNEVNFVHVQSGTTIHLEYDGDDHSKMYMTIDPSATTVPVSIAIDYDAFVLMPKYVAFLADNGKFYKNKYLGGGFNADDIDDEDIVCEIVTMNNGTIGIRRKGQDSSGKLLDWRKYNNRENYNNVVAVDTIDATDGHERYFWVVKVDNNVVALRDIDSGMFCQRSTTTTQLFSNYIDNALVTTAKSLINKSTRFQVIEVGVMSRKISMLEYDTDKSRIYNITPLSTEQAVFDNPTNVEQQATLNLSITTTSSTMWSNSIGVTAGFQVSLEAEIPLIADEQVTISASVSYEHVWQGSVDKAQTVGSEYTIKVPAKTRAVASGVATQATCDVPFKYVQMDKLSTGETVRVVLTDGIFTGVNAYNFYYKVDYFDIDDNNSTSLVHVQDHRKKKANFVTVQELVD